MRSVAWHPVQVMAYLASQGTLVSMGMWTKSHILETRTASELAMSLNRLGQIHWSFHDAARRVAEDAIDGKTLKCVHAR